jgi:hypothetical protein
MSTLLNVLLRCTDERCCMQFESHQLANDMFVEVWNFLRPSSRTQHLAESGFHKVRLTWCLFVRDVKHLSNGKEAHEILSVVAALKSVIHKKTIEVRKAETYPLTDIFMHKLYGSDARGLQKDTEKCFLSCGKKDDLVPLKPLFAVCVTFIQMCARLNHWTFGQSC